MHSSSKMSRYVRLTEAGSSKIQAARRKYRLSLEDIVGDPHTPSVNTVKRALRKDPVFVSTLERIWDYLRQAAIEHHERLPYLVEGEDYVYLEDDETGAAGSQTGSDHKSVTSAEVAGGVDGLALSESVAHSATPDVLQTSMSPLTFDSNATVNLDANQSHGVVASPFPGWLSRHVPRPNRLFTGRREALERLDLALAANPSGLMADTQALTGLGGIGKTQTAIAYIYRHWRSYSRVFWVNAESVESLKEGLAGLAEELGLLSDVRASKSQALEQMQDWFRTETGWLLVLDNADDMETLAPYFPRNHNGRLLITTRARNTVRWAAPIALRRFEPEEGALLLLRRAGLLEIDMPLEGASQESSQLVGEAQALSEELGGLPLAIDQAGAYIAETSTTVAGYRKLFREQGLSILDRVADPEHASLSITFTLAFEQMAAHTLYGSAALDTVRLSAFLAPEEIPEVIFAAAHGQHQAGCGGWHLEKPKPAADPMPPIEEIVSAVTRFSLATRHIGNQTLTVHRLVQLVTREALSKQEQQAWKQRTVEAVAAATPDFEVEQWPLCDLLLPQWRVCAEYIREGVGGGAAAYLLYQAGRYLRARALFAEAETFTRQALSMAESAYGPLAIVVADCVDELACLCRVRDRREEAEILHARAIEIIEQTLDPEHVLLMSKLHNRAIFYMQTGQDAKAEPLFLRALAIHERQPEPNFLLMATAQTQLAGVYRNRGDYVQAERYGRLALETYERLLPPDHIDIATACNNLGLLYLTMGRQVEAEKHYARALSINLTMRGEEHPETGTVLWGLARVRWLQDRAAEADVFFQRAVRIYTMRLGTEHSRTARILESYAEFRRGMHAP